MCFVCSYNTAILKGGGGKKRASLFCKFIIRLLYFRGREGGSWHSPPAECARQQWGSSWLCALRRTDAKHPTGWTCRTLAPVSPSTAALIPCLCLPAVRRPPAREGKRERERKRRTSAPFFLVFSLDRPLRVRETVPKHRDWTLLERGNYFSHEASWICCVQRGRTLLRLFHGFQYSGGTLGIKLLLSRC